MQNKIVNFYYFVRKIRYWRYRRLLSSEKFTIFSSNCFAGIIYNTLGAQFCSPTINNAFFGNNVFYCFLNNLQSYFNSKLVFDYYDKEHHPVCHLSYPGLPNITIGFIHDVSFETVESNWYKRAKRVCLDKILVVDCIFKGNEKYINDFFNLPFKHKLLIVDRSIDDSFIRKNLKIYKTKHANLNDMAEICRLSKYNIGHRYFDICHFEKEILKIIKETKNG